MQAVKSTLHPDVLELAQLQLASHRGLRLVRCQMEEGTLVLSGSVSSYYLKQLAQGLVLNRLEGITPVTSTIEVES
jgi:hypothetical protein